MLLRTQADTVSSGLSIFKFLNVHPGVGLQDHRTSESSIQYFQGMSQKAEVLIRLQVILKHNMVHNLKGTKFGKLHVLN